MYTLFSDSRSTAKDVITGFQDAVDQFDIHAFLLSNTSVRDVGTVASFQSSNLTNFFIVSSTTYSVIAQHIAAGQTQVYVDVNHNGNWDTSADLVINLTNNVHMDGSEFIF